MKPFSVRRKTFIFYREWLDIILGLEKEEQMQAVLAIAEFALTGERPDCCAEVDAILDKAEEKIEKDYDRFREYMRKFFLSR